MQQTFENTGQNTSSSDIVIKELDGQVDWNYYSGGSCWKGHLHCVGDVLEYLSMKKAR